MKSLKSAEKGTSKGNIKDHELPEIYVHTVKIIWHDLISFLVSSWS